MNGFVTRFNPTTNGDLHLGHVFTMLFNERIAHESGGRFIVRFEDNGIDTLYVHSALDMEVYCRRQREAIEWLRVPVDEWIRQSEMDLALREFVAKHDWFIPEYRWPYSIPIDATKLQYNPEQGELFPYAPFVTYNKVIYDELNGTNVLIRGMDLISEFTLYQHYRKKLGLKQIDHYYLPRIYGPNEETISKFYGAKSVLEYRDDGFNPGDIKELLAQSALKEPGAGWHLWNVKPAPRLVEELGFTPRDHHHIGSGATHGSIRTYQP